MSTNGTIETISNYEQRFGPIEDTFPSDPFERLPRLKGPLGYEPVDASQLQAQPGQLNGHNRDVIIELADNGDSMCLIEFCGDVATASLISIPSEA